MLFAKVFIVVAMLAAFIKLQLAIFRWGKTVTRSEHYGPEDVGAFLIVVAICAGLAYSIGWWTL